MNILKLLLISKNQQNIDRIKNFVSDGALIDIIIEPYINTVYENIENDAYEIVLIDYDCYPIRDIQKFIMSLRDDVLNYKPIIIISPNDDDTLETIETFSVNDKILIPLDKNDFDEKINNAKRLLAFLDRLEKKADETSELVGVLSKTAFHKIFISCLDRYNRYGEKTYLTLLTIDNIRVISSTNGEFVAEQLGQKLKKYVLEITRLSDIVARTAQNEMCILLTRPHHENEPQMAFERFVKSFKTHQNNFYVGGTKAILRAHMLAIPSGKVIFEEEI
jgi:PleD family two-component response regulator